jgi:hypothetical protein
VLAAGGITPDQFPRQGEDNVDVAGGQQLPAPLALQNKRLIYNLLFHASAQTLLEIARDSRHLGAEIGFSGPVQNSSPVVFTCASYGFGEGFPTIHPERWCAVALQPHCVGIHQVGVPRTCLKALPSRRDTCIGLPQRYIKSDRRF